MRRIEQQEPTAAHRATVAGAARRALLLSCALASCGVWTEPAAAQSSSLRGASRDVNHKRANDALPASGEVRIASGQNPSAAQRAKTAQPSVAQKSSATPARVRQSPPIRLAQATEIGSPASTEVLPLPPMKETLPLAGSDTGEGLQLTQNGEGLITLIVRDKSLSQVLALIAQTQSLNIVASNDIDALITITLRDVPLEQALTAILSVANYTWVKRNNIILITSLTDATNLPADVQGRQIQVFDLDFASATVVAETVKNFLSPIGKVSLDVSDPTNNRLTQERVVVEDLPESLARIADYIAQIDQAPRQVLIEAHVLQVKLDDTTRCGVDFNALGLNDNLSLVPVPRLATNGLASPIASPAFVATLGNTDLGVVIELLQKTTDAKTLGSPKVLVLNEQEARLQVGKHQGYATSTTTETSTIQTVQFLDTGVILSIKPRITRDNRVLLHVRPEVSDGGIVDGLPDSTTAELETDVMLHDNEGMVIGGLIQEKDSTEQSKVPYLGNVKGVGFLFRRSVVTKERTEIIVALVPRIQPYCQQYHDFEEGELVKASVPLMHGPLCRTDRPWDPVLPDGKRVSYPLIPNRHAPPPRGYFHDLGPGYVIPPDPLPTQEFCDDPCVPTAPMPAGPAPQDPTLQSEDLPLPAASDDLHGSQIISDQ